MKLKQLIQSIPFVNNAIGYCYLRLKSIIKPFRDSQYYWESRYQSGGNSGCGSYDGLCLFKSEVLNKFFTENHIISIIDFGCGDGNQLKYLKTSSYIGFDVSQSALDKCCDIFKDDSSKKFKLMDEYKEQTAELCLSLDVIYHLVEDDVFEQYMATLFSAAQKYVIIYSSNKNKQAIIQSPHVKHRLFSDWIKQNQPNWELATFIENKYPLTPRNPTGSFADFYIYKKISSPN